MEAQLFRVVAILAASLSLGAGYRTTNFIVNAPTPELAEKIGRSAEKYRHDLAMEWLGKPMRSWGQPCPITAQVADRLGAGGATSFVFEHGEVFGWQMNIQGSEERILDSVLPHEVTHTVFATHFRQPLPRWADEGACTTVEHSSERLKQQNMLVDFLRTDRGIPFSRMFVMKEYPQDVMPLYSQGYSLARFFIARGGKRKFLDYLADGLRDENWTRATKAHYDFANLATLQSNWLEWVREGSQPLKPAPQTILASNQSSNPADKTSPASDVIFRAQSVDSVKAKPKVNEIAANDTGVSNIGDNNSAYDRLAADNGADTNVGRAQPAAPSPEATPTSESAPQAGFEPRRQLTAAAKSAASRQIILEWSKPRVEFDAAKPQTPATTRR